VPVEIEVVNGIIACGTAQRVQLTYDLPERIIDETCNKVTYTFRWRGDRIVGIKPNNPEWLPMYPDF
jgi:hypothetical protein